MDGLHLDTATGILVSLIARLFYVLVGLLPLCIRPLTTHVVANIVQRRLARGRSCRNIHQVHTVSGLHWTLPFADR